MDDIAIKVEHVSKTFKLPHEKRTSLKTAFVRMFTKQSYEVQKALNDVSFEVKKGEFFGIVGRNGSGKSTLLKILAGTYVATEGNVSIGGTLTPFIELGVGFNPELTGRENVFLNGALLGFNRKEMGAMYEDIVAFAEIEKFMDQKLKNYSSGMQVRLAFSIAIKANSDVLLLDEVLAVGDENFQKKCIATFRQIKNKGTTVILVSHDMNMVEQFCDKAILIEQGNKVYYGKSSDVARHYRDINRDIDKAKTARGKLSGDRTKVVDGEGIGVVSIDTKVLDAEGKPTEIIDSNDEIIVESTLIAKEAIKNALHSFTFEDLEGKTIAQFSTDDNGGKLFDMKKNEKKVIRTTVENIFSEGIYYIDPDVSTFGREVIYGHIDNAWEFEVRVRKTYPWLLRPTYTINEKSAKSKITR